MLGPDIIDPRQMDMIRRQAESAARDMELLGSRELPSITQIAAVKVETAEAVVEAAPVDADALSVVLPVGGTPWAEADDIREKRRLRALARKALRATRRAAQAEGE